MHEIDYQAIFDEILQRNNEDIDPGEENHPKNTGWHFGAGVPEHRLFSDRLLVPGGRLLDIGCGMAARASLFFAFGRMRVTAIDRSAKNIEILNRLVETIEHYPILNGTSDNFHLPVEGRVADVLEEDVEPESFDTALLEMVLLHVPNRQVGHDLVDKAVGALKIGGHLWLRTAGVEDASYLETGTEGNGHHQVRWIDGFTAKASCFHGHDDDHAYRTFYTQTELLEHVSKLGMRIVHTQVMPNPPVELTEQESQQFIHLRKDFNFKQQSFDAFIKSLKDYDKYLLEVASRTGHGRANVMYGENWSNRDYIESTSGMISILAQKTARNPLVGARLH